MVNVNIEGIPIYYMAGNNPFFQADPGLALWTWIVFFALLGVLYKFAWKPILRSLDEREDRISKSLNEAERIEKEIQAVQEKNEAILKEARNEAQKIIEKSREIAENDKTEIRKKAEEEANLIIEKAKLSIEQEKTKAVDYLREESVRLGIQIAEKLIEENLDDDKNYQLSKRYMEEVAKF